MLTAEIMFAIMHLTGGRGIGLLGGECRANGLETYSRRSENCNVSKVCLIKDLW